MEERTADHSPAQSIPVARPAPGTSRSWFARFLGGMIRFVLVMLFFPLLILVFAAFGFSGFQPQPGVTESFHSLNEQGTEKVALIRVEGTILDGEGFVKKQIDRVRADDSVKAVVLRIDSPGGTVSASDYIYHHLGVLIKEREIPLVVSMGGLAASGGYYVAMAVGDEEEAVFAEPTTWTGSIGVIIPHYDISGLLERWSIEENSIASHRLKGMGNPARPMTEEEREIFRALVEDSFSRFKEIILAGRPQMSREELQEVATGQVFTAEQAKANGLVDRIGFVEDAIDRAIELASLDSSQVKAVEYKPPQSLVDLMWGMQSRAPTGDLKALVDLASPRAYYLFTWLPARLSAR